MVRDLPPGPLFLMYVRNESASGEATRRGIRRPVLFLARKPGRGLPIPALTVCADLITYDLNHNVCVVVDVSQFLPLATRF